jgi:PAS domain S-box-containing protein
MGQKSTFVRGQMSAALALRDEIPEIGLGLPVQAIELLFDHLPGACFFTTDAALHYTSANAAMVALCGARDRSSVIGRSARDFFAEPARQRHELADLRVMRTGRPCTKQLDRCVRLRGRPVWLLVNRWPILQGDRAIGVATVAQCLDLSEHRQPMYIRLASAIDYLHANFGASFDYQELAASAGVSHSQLQRDFLQVLGLSPRSYLTRVRFEAALDMLAENRPIVEIAHACGYADQSAFTRRFSSAIGMSPVQYRRSEASRRFALGA